MENFLPLIQTTLTEWLQLTIDHPLYAAVLVITVWIITALLYSIKVAGLTKKNTVNEQIKIVAEANLNNAQQQLQQVQDQLATATEQQARSQKLADTEKQRALIAEQQLIKRNQQIGAIIQSLASRFDIGQRPLPVTEDLKADDLWQQHDKVIQQLIERLLTEQLAKTELEKFYQAEKAKAATTEAQLSSLQANMDNQNSLLATVQQELAGALKKHQTDHARLVELERQATPFSKVQRQPEIIVTPVESTNTVEQATPSLTNTESVDDSVEKLKSLFKKPVQQQPAIASVPDITPPVVIIDTASVLVDNKQSDIKPEPIVESKPTPALIEEIAEKTSNVSALKGFYQKFTTVKSESIAVDPKPVVESKPAPIKETAEKTSNVAVLKGLYQKFTPSKPEQTAEVVLEPKVIEPVVKTLETTMPLEQPKPAVARKFAPSKRLEVKPLTVEPSSRIDETADLITEKVDKLKNLYGKFFSKSE